MTIHHHLTYGPDRMYRRVVEEDAHIMEGKMVEDQTDGYLVNSRRSHH
jgi:hypothetical protein